MPNTRYLFVYLLTNTTRSVLYTGVTGDLRRRVAQHRAGQGGRFSRRYRARRLVWYEIHENPVTAILREKQIKAGPRRQKLALINTMNPEWRDLAEDL
jgi:putative endonuclease